MIDLLGYKNFIDSFGNPKLLLQDDSNKRYCYGFDLCQPKCIVNYEFGPSNIYKYTDPLLERSYIRYSTSLQKISTGETLNYTGDVTFYIYYKQDPENVISSPSELLNTDGSPTINTSVLKNTISFDGPINVVSKTIYPTIDAGINYAYTIAYKPICCCTDWVIVNNVWHIIF